MQLSIKYEVAGSSVAEGAFIRGGDAGDWLREIAGWQTPLDKLTCFVLADRSDMRTPAGLFVVWQENFSPVWSHRVYPYKKIAEKLYIPVDASLSPAVLPAELASLLIWDFQFFHPVHGFTGYERKDKLVWTAVLELAAPVEKDWSFASPGMSALPMLQRISLFEMSEEEMFEEQKEQINSKPIEELGAEERKKNFLTRLWDKLYLALLKSILKGLHGFIKLLPSGRECAIDLSGPINRMMNWANTRVEELEQQRRGELQRLLDLFENNIDEALQYAIPLSSPYLDRGKASPGSKLTRRDTSFNLGRLGGGERADSWSVDGYYNSLRNKYERAAEQAIASGDFKKAAYIYAHLMGNYVAAAKALEQGKYFHEAAALYKDHLSNPAAAAECLEKGGLLSEAILLYQDMGRTEKCGDLCQLLGQDERACEYFKEAASTASGKKDFKEQARILKDKVKDRPGAKEALLKGWRTDRHPEYFLKEYFDMYAEEDPGQLHRQVRRAYQQKDISYNREAFLQVLAKVNAEHSEEELVNTCQDIAFDIVSEEAAGNPNIVPVLRKFFPDDPLLGSDCHRFMHRAGHTGKISPPMEQRLSADAIWVRAVTAKGQVLVIGIAGHDIIVARGNWKGKWEYNMLMGNVATDAHLVITGGKELLRFVLHTNGIGPGQIDLKTNSVFSEELVIESPNWMPVGVKGIAVTQYGVAVFHNENMDFFISRYDRVGGLVSSNRCIADSLPVNLHGFTERAREMVWLDGYYYLPAGLVLLRISERGEMAAMPADSWIKDLQLIKQGDTMCLAMLTSGNSRIIKTAEFDVPETTVSLIDDVEAIAMGVTEQGLLALADQVMLMVYDFPDGNLELICNVPLKEPPIAILPTSRRNQLGVISKTGMVTLIDVPPAS